MCLNVDILFINVFSAFLIFNDVCYSLQGHEVFRLNCIVCQTVCGSSMSFTLILVHKIIPDALKNWREEVESHLRSFLQGMNDSNLKKALRLKQRRTKCALIVLSTINFNIIVFVSSLISRSFSDKFLEMKTFVI